MSCAALLKSLQFLLQRPVCSAKLRCTSLANAVDHTRHYNADTVALPVLLHVAEQSIPSKFLVMLEVKVCESRDLSMPATVELTRVAYPLQTWQESTNLTTKPNLEPKRGQRLYIM